MGKGEGKDEVGFFSKDELEKILLMCNGKFGNVDLKYRVLLPSDKNMVLKRQGDRFLYDARLNFGGALAHLLVDYKPELILECSVYRGNSEKNYPQNSELRVLGGWEQSAQDWARHIASAYGGKIRRDSIEFWAYLSASNYASIGFANEGFNMGHIFDDPILREAFGQGTLKKLMDKSNGGYYSSGLDHLMDAFVLWAFLKEADELSSQPIPGWLEKIAKLSMGWYEWEKHGYPYIVAHKMKEEVPGNCMGIFGRYKTQASANLIEECWGDWRIDKKLSVVAANAFHMRKEKTFVEMGFSPKRSIKKRGSNIEDKKIVSLIEAFGEHPDGTYELKLDPEVMAEKIMKQLNGAKFLSGFMARKIVRFLVLNDDRMMELMPNQYHYTGSVMGFFLNLKGRVVDLKSGGMSGVKELNMNFDKLLEQICSVGEMKIRDMVVCSQYTITDEAELTKFLDTTCRSLAKMKQRDGILESVDGVIVDRSNRKKNKI